MKNKFYLVAGEASGDMYGALLIDAIRERVPDATFRGCGGDRMEAAGASLLLHYRDLAFMGFKEVLGNLQQIFRYLRACKTDIQNEQPGTVILIDYPGFNLRIAAFAKKRGFRVVWYISPQVWAWKANRVYKLRKYVDEMITILPFEPEFYRKYNMKVHYSGHPLLDVADKTRKDPGFFAKHNLDEKSTIALIPGSRKQEIYKMLPIMLEACEDFPGFQYAIACAPGIDPEFYKVFTQNHPNARLVENDAWQLMLHARAGMVTSGTATLEAALFGLPQVVCYKGSRISFWLGRMLVNVPYISLVNLILERKAVEELIQQKFTTANLVNALQPLTTQSAPQLKMLDDYRELRKRLGGVGATQKAADIICNKPENSFQ